MSVIKERNNLRKKGKNPLSLEIWIFRTGQLDRDEDPSFVCSDACIVLLCNYSERDCIV